MPAENHPLLRKSIHIRRRELLLSVTLILPKNPDVTGAQIVAENENDIGPVRCLRRFSRCTQWHQSRHEAC